MEIAKAAGRTIQHRPVDLDRVVATSGAGPFSERTKAHAEYYFVREINRWSEYREAPVMEGFPTHHFNDMTLANCILIAADNAGTNIDLLAHAFLESHWRDDSDLADADTLTRVAEGAGYDLAPFKSAAGSDEVRAIYEANTVEAIERNDQAG